MLAVGLWQRLVLARAGLASVCGGAVCGPLVCALIPSDSGLCGCWLCWLCPSADAGVVLHVDVVGARLVISPWDRRHLHPPLLRVGVR